MGGKKLLGQDLSHDLFLLRIFAAQHSFPSGNTSEQEVGFSGVANHYPD